MPKSTEAHRIYGFRERLLLAPQIHRLKRLRNALVSRLYSRRPAENLDAVRAELGDVRDQNLLFVVAFNLPWAIDLMIRSTRRHMPDWRLVIVDNSKDPDARAEIAEICRAAGVPCLALPRNPEWSPNRSHGLALNWTWTNLIRPLRPKHFGFLDHDCFPIRPSRQLARLADRPFDGLKIAPERVVGAWYLWAGYMFFDTARIGDRDLDFNHDQVLRLDTAGRNWTKLYRDFDGPDLDLLTPANATLAMPDGSGAVEVLCIDDTVVHVGGASYRGEGELRAPREAVRAVVEASLA